MNKEDRNVMTFGIIREIDPRDPQSSTDIEREMKEQLIDDVIKKCPQAVKLIWKENNEGLMTLGAKIKIVVEE
jgi:hypothetical protein